MLKIQSELFYELTTPVYSENIEKTIYLNPIGYSAILPFTTVKGKGGMIIPLIIYNLSQRKYELTLGEASLIQPYRNFLMDALLAQCNRSSCFDLVVNDGNITLPDSALILDVKINGNATTTKMTYNDGAFFNPFESGYFTGFSNWVINSPTSWLDISVSLMQGEKSIWEKTYTATENLSYKRERIEDPHNAYENCIDAMTENLSSTTKGVVENISRDLHFFILYK